jgi:hypothetical protein
MINNWNIKEIANGKIFITNDVFSFDAPGTVLLPPLHVYVYDFQER